MFSDVDRKSSVMVLMSYVPAYGVSDTEETLLPTVETA